MRMKRYFRGKRSVTGAVYALEKECLFSADGEILLSPEKFLERFGDGKDKECSIIELRGGDGRI